MERLLLVSMVLGWLMVIGLGLTLAVMFQLLGEIHLRSPLGHHALMTDEGPALHEPLPDFVAPDATGRPVAAHDYIGHELVVLFASPSCGPCLGLVRAIAPTLRELSQAPEALLVFEASPEQREQVSRVCGPGTTVVFDPEARVRDALGIRRVPFAVRVDRDGTTRMKGVANNRQQLEGLIAGRGHRLDGAIWQAPPAAERPLSQQPDTTTSPAWEDA